MRVRWQKWVIALIALGIAAGPGTTRADDLQDAFKRVLSNPTDAEANFRYAELSEQKGDIRKALAALERILIADPNNAKARAEYQRVRALLDPPSTRYTATLGVQYDSNVRLLDDELPHENDVSGYASLNVTDSRTIDERRWRSNGYLFANAHESFSRDNLVYGLAQTGPLFTLDNGWRVRTAPTVEIATLDTNLFFYGLGAALNFETNGTDALKNIDLSVMHQDYDPRYFGRDAVVFGAKAYLSWSNVLYQGALLFFEPSYRFNLPEGSSRTNEYHQLAGRVGYLAPLASNVLGFQRVYALPEVTLEGRRYTLTRLDTGNARRDFEALPGFRLIGSGLVWPNLDVNVGYLRVRNVSNVDGRDFTNDQVTASVNVRF